MTDEQVRARNKVYQARYRKKSRAKRREYNNRFNAETGYKKKWIEENRQSVRLSQQKYYMNNKDVVAASARTWAEANPISAKIASLMTAARRAAKKRGLIHPECDYVEERKIYTECVERRLSSGRKFHVDHIIPIRFGGWHHHLNLQILPEFENTSKGQDPFWESAGYKDWSSVPQFLWPEKLAPSYHALLCKRATQLISASA
jgi:hypothetical protein